MREHSRKDAGEMWCFGCRARHPHELVTHVATDPLSYFGPTFRYDCARCHRDRTCFPGTCRVWSVG